MRGMMRRPGQAQARRAAACDSAGGKGSNNGAMGPNAMHRQAARGQRVAGPQPRERGSARERRVTAMEPHRSKEDSRLCPWTQFPYRWLPRSGDLGPQTSSISAGGGVHWHWALEQASHSSSRSRSQARKRASASRKPSERGCVRVQVQRAGRWNGTTEDLGTGRDRDDLRPFRLS